VLADFPTDRLWGGGLTGLVAVVTGAGTGIGKAVALALASVNPRGGRSGNMIFVVLSFVVYNNLVNLGQSWIFVGLIGFGNLLLALHGGVLLLGLAWLAKRHYNWTLRLKRRPRLAPMTARAGSQP